MSTDVSEMTDEQLKAVVDADPLQTIEDEEQEAREALEKLAVKIADNEPVDTNELRELMRRAGVDRSFVDARVNRRRQRLEAAKAISDAEIFQRQADEARAESARLVREVETRTAEIDAEAARQKQELQPLFAKASELNDSRIINERNAHNNRAFGNRVLEETAPVWIQRAIDKLKRESQQVSRQVVGISTELENRVNALEKRAAYWRGLIERLERHPMIPKRPDGLSREDSQAWNWFFSLQNPLAGGQSISDRRKSFVEGLEGQAHSERECLSERLREIAEINRPLFQRKRENNAEIADLEQLKFKP